jgi:hypothetical protein
MKRHPNSHRSRLLSIYTTMRRQLSRRHYSHRSRLLTAISNGTAAFKETLQSQVTAPYSNKQWDAASTQQVWDTASSANTPRQSQDSAHNSDKGTTAHKESLHSNPPLTKAAAHYRKAIGLFHKIGRTISQICNRDILGLRSRALSPRYHKE